MLKVAMPEVLQPRKTDEAPEETPEEAVDPRILRSRQMLMEALARLLDRKDFDQISIQEIAAEATLNRATFYLHYPDKNALLLAMTATRFRALIARRGLSFTNCDSALRAIALGVLDFLAESTSCPSHLLKMPLERSIIPVVEDVFREGADKHEAVPGADPELMGTTAAWAIFGAARRWYETPNRIPAEEMATRIERMVKPIFLSAST
jgi:AcrR family transcriptional regulator